MLWYQQVAIFLVSLLFWGTIYLSKWRQALGKQPWKVSLIHACITCLLSAYICFGEESVRNKHFDEIPNDQLPLGIALTLFSLAYFFCDLICGWFSWAYTSHHVLVLVAYLVTLFFGSHLKGLLLHLFFSEVGNIVHHARYAGFLGPVKTTTLSDGLFVLINRACWLYFMVPSTLLRMLDPQQWPEAWQPQDYVSFWGSLFLMVGNALFSLRLLYRIFHPSPLHHHHSTHNKKEAKPHSH